MTISRKDFADEDRLIRRMKGQGHTADQLRSWLRGWRQVGERQHEKQKEIEARLPRARHFP